MWNTKQTIYITAHSMHCLKPWQLFEMLQKSGIWKIRCLGLSFPQYGRMCMYTYMLLWINENAYISWLLQMKIKHMQMCLLTCLFLLFRSACWKWSVAHNSEEADQVYSNQGIFIIMSPLSFWQDLQNHLHYQSEMVLWLCFFRMQHIIVAPSLPSVILNDTMRATVRNYVFHHQVIAEYLHIGNSSVNWPKSTVCFRYTLSLHQHR